jgi:hypothetical protein
VLYFNIFLKKQNNKQCSCAKDVTLKKVSTKLVLIKKIKNRPQAVFDLKK